MIAGWATLEEMKETVAIIGYRQLLSFGLVYGCGLKILDVPIFDEAVAGVSLVGRLLSRRRLSRPAFVSELAMFYYMLFLSVIGVLLTSNVNVLRFVLIALFMLFHNSRENFAIASLICGAKGFIFTYFVIVVVGSVFHLPVAFWQEGLWTGTAYAAVFCCFSAWLCVLFAKDYVSASLIVVVYLAIAVLAESRLQLLLSIVPASAFLARFRIPFTRWRFALSSSFAKALALAILCAVVAANFRDKIDVFDYVAISYKSAVLSLEEIVAGDKEQDEDRKDSIRAAVDWAVDHPLQSVTGSGLLAHQEELARYYPPSSDGKVRPVGISALVVDGGGALLALLLLNAFMTVLRIQKGGGPFLLKLSSTIVLVVAVLSMLVTNLFDAILFWLIVIPSGILPFVIREWSFRFGHRQRGTAPLLPTLAGFGK